MSANIPAKRKAKGVPPLESETASPKTAKIPPPTMPPTPMEMASLSPILSLILNLVQEKDDFRVNGLEKNVTWVVFLIRQGQF